MLATTDLWFRYQDEPVLEGADAGFFPSRGDRTGGGERLRKIHAVYEPERSAAPAERGGAVAGKPLDYSKRDLLALRQQVATVFQDPDQQIFYTDIDSDIAFSLRNLGVAEEEIARRVDDALTRRCPGVSSPADSVPEPRAEKARGDSRRAGAAGALFTARRADGGARSLGRAQMIDIIKRIADRGNHVAISSHDIDLIYEISDAVYVLRRGKCWRTANRGVFARSELMAQAGLTSRGW